MGANRAAGSSLDVRREWPQRQSTPRDLRVRAGARGCDGGVREKLAEEESRDGRIALFGQRARSAVGPHGPRGIKSVPLFPPPVDHFLGRKNCCSARPLNRSLLRLRGYMCDPRPLASAGGNLDLVPNAPVLHDAAPITNKVHFSGKGMAAISNAWLRFDAAMAAFAKSWRSE